MPLFNLFQGRADTNRKKKHAKNSYLKQSFKKSLGNGVNLKDAVKCPPGEDRDEWIVMNTMEVYNNTTLCWQFVSEVCNEKTCPTMSAGSTFSYLWKDKGKYPKPTNVPAAEYVELLTLWVSEKLDDETIFPTSGKFPREFMPTVENIWKRLVRIYFHIYYHHWNTVSAVKAEAHINTCFKHLYYFSKEFHLVKDDDMAPIGDVQRKIDS
ncbi:MOB kinase activator-like 3-like [Planoprotostelium fungivorum]|uniref:MOB kinase activator-like 3-like n=1 Tax=Planoprotostelium fungivorum TaxID=1890364 RepID=A0A2P6NYH7_9EUKA|nr:MOB kinase activator-like 3-like [Planoprotostelium fungivorum]